MSEGEQSTATNLETSTTRANQDGWSFMTSNLSMVLWKRTFYTDDKKRNISACVSAKTTFFEKEIRFLTQNYTYYNTCNTTWNTFPKNFTASSNDSSGEQLDLFNSTYKNSPLRYYVLYTDEECLLTKLLHASNETVRACELFTRENYTENENSTCEVRFRCDCDPAVQWLYNKTQCDQLNQNMANETITPENC